MAVARWLSLSFLLAGCVLPPAASPSAPSEASQTVEGTLSCGQILSDCDAECAAPDCVEACGSRGTHAAQRLHAALVECAKTSGCLEQTCVMERCGTEVEACQADASGTAPAETPAPPAETPAPSAPDAAPAGT